MNLLEDNTKKLPLMDTSKKDNNSLINLYLNSLCPAGEMVGLKAAMASTEPYS